LDGNVALEEVWLGYNNTNNETQSVVNFLEAGAIIVNVTDFVAHVELETTFHDSFHDSFSIPLSPADGIPIEGFIVRAPRGIRIIKN